MLLLLLLTACGSPEIEGSSCEGYVNAVAACATARGAPADGYDADALCATWDDAHEAAYGDYYACRTEAYEGSDCTTDAGWAAAITADACCTPPGGEPSDDPSCS